MSRSAAILAAGRAGIVPAQAGSLRNRPAEAGAPE